MLKLLLFVALLFLLFRIFLWGKSRTPSAPPDNWYRTLARNATAQDKAAWEAKHAASFADNEPGEACKVCQDATVIYTFFAGKIEEAARGGRCDLYMSEYEEGIPHECSNSEAFNYVVHTLLAREGVKFERIDPSTTDDPIFEEGHYSFTW